jgi:ectoine hydroxylase-related dioxygenase (phytanoyl-CoA dioxygenase family)
MLSSYGVQQATVPASVTDRHAEDVRIKGFTIVREVVDTATATTLAQALDRHYKTQADEIGGVERLQQIRDADVVRCPLSVDPAFLEAARSPKLLELMRELLGDYFILQQQNGVINPPSTPHHQQSWHRDLPHQHFTSSRPLAVSVLIFLDKFSQETGATMVLPASHKTEPFPSEHYVSAHEVSLEGLPGDAAVFDSMLFHRAGANTSSNIRRGLIQVYSLPFFFQPVSLSRAVLYPITDSTVRKFLGFDIEPAASASEWRRRRFERVS